VPLWNTGKAPCVTSSSFVRPNLYLISSLRSPQRVYLSSLSRTFTWSRIGPLICGPNYPHSSRFAPSICLLYEFTTCCIGFATGSEASCTSGLCCRANNFNTGSPNKTVLPAPRCGFFHWYVPKALAQQQEDSPDYAMEQRHVFLTRCCCPRSHSCSYCDK
jgi:hypothetical protein